MTARRERPAVTARSPGTGARALDLAGIGATIYAAPKTTSMKYNVHEAKTHLSKLLDRVAAGTEKGRVFVADDFDAPLPEDILKAFEA